MKARRGLQTKPSDSVSGGWTGWHGPHRNGRVLQLPGMFSVEPDRVWEQPFFHSGLSGIAATSEYVVLEIVVRKTVWQWLCLRTVCWQLETVHCFCSGQTAVRMSPPARRSSRVVFLCAAVPPSLNVQIYLSVEHCIVWILSRQPLISGDVRFTGVIPSLGFQFT